MHLNVLSPVPGSPPYGLSYESISPSEVNVTWQPPLLPNGVITHYSLELWNSTHFLNLTSTSSHIHITHLRKYAQYRVMVQAHTHVGPGNFSSEPLNITTLEDGEAGEGREGARACFHFQEAVWLRDDWLISFEGHLIKCDFPLIFSSSASVFQHILMLLHHRYLIPHDTQD